MNTVDSIECKAAETYDAICRAVDTLEKLENADGYLRIIEKAKKIQGKAEHAVTRLKSGASSARTKAKIYVGTDWSAADPLLKNTVFKDIQRGKKEVERCSGHLFRHIKKIMKIMEKVDRSLEKQRSRQSN